MTGYVDAHNSFGATLRTRYTATVAKPEGSGSCWRLDGLRILK